MISWGYIGVMEKNLKTTVVYWGYIMGIMELSTYLVLNIYFLCLKASVVEAWNSEVLVP